MGIWEQSVCLVHPDVPTASTGEPQTHLHAQGDTRRLHSPLQPGVWGSTTISPEFTFEAKHKCLGGQKQPGLCAQDPQLCSHPLAHPAPRGASSTFCRNMELTCGFQLYGESRGLVFVSPGILFPVRRQILSWRGSFSPAFPLPLPSSFFCQRLLEVHATHLPFSTGEARPQQTHVAVMLSLG